jgi:hypothetical protein
LQDEIEKTKKQNQLTNKTIIGYTLLYLLLGADKDKSNIVVEYGDCSNNNTKTISYIKEYNRCWENLVIEPITKIEYPLRRCVFVNVNPNKEISIHPLPVQIALKRY